MTPSCDGVAAVGAPDSAGLYHARGEARARL